jgi:hypothetical protein
MHHGVLRESLARKEKQLSILAFNGSLLPAGGQAKVIALALEANRFVGDGRSSGSSSIRHVYTPSILSPSFFL